ncbi:acyltransferase domain-containing protein [Streptomyces polygonati]|uniref:Acyltransferase domain-containing protein n=1 Tax=Streptomyces polygonati TaxID=1617087 RepID=A0ABV8HJ79_9ACTN
MAAGLYGSDAVFTAHMDAFFAGYGPDGAALRDVWLRPAPNPKLGDALLTQPLLFAVGQALGRAVAEWEGAPQVYLGHSVGELAAACLAGVFGPDEGGALMAARSKALGTDGAGGMLAVSAPADAMAPYATGEVAVAAVNGPRQTVLAGPDGPLDWTQLRLTEGGFTFMRLRSSHAFHSPVLRPAADRFAAVLGRVGLRPPQAELYSSRTARPVRADEAVRPEFWAGQLALTVRYWPALSALLDTEGTEPGLVLLDASVDNSLSAPVRRHPAVRGGATVVVPLLAPGTEGTPAELAAFEAAREQVLRSREGSPAQAPVS